MGVGHTVGGGGCAGKEIRHVDAVVVTRHGRERNIRCKFEVLLVLLYVSPLMHHTRREDE